METPTCPKCSESLVWREPTDMLREQMFVTCGCTDIDFTRSELAATSTGPESKLYSHSSMNETKADGRNLRADIKDYWGTGALYWIECRAGVRS